MMNRQVRTKLDYLPRITPSFDDKAVNERDRQYKEKIKQKATNRISKEHDYKINDHVLLYSAVQRYDNFILSLYIRNWNGREKCTG